MRDITYPRTKPLKYTMRDITIPSHRAIKIYNEGHNNTLSQSH